MGREWPVRFGWRPCDRARQMRSSRPPPDDVPVILADLRQKQIVRPPNLRDLKELPTTAHVPSIIWHALFMLFIVTFVPHFNTIQPRATVRVLKACLAIVFA